MTRVVLISGLLLAGCATVQQQPSRLIEAGVKFDRDHETGAFAEGVADPRTGRPVTVSDPVRVASISKLVVAIGVMKLVEAGKLNLDSDVSQWLGWSLRNSAFPDAQITLRELLSHTSSVRDHDDQYAIPLGRTVREVMTDRRSWDARHGPGQGWFSYSNLNFPIIASIVERATGERFDLWMKRNVLDAMKLDACFNWATCSDAAVAASVELDGPDGRPIKDDLHRVRPGCPVISDEHGGCDLGGYVPGENGALFAPQGGLRISPRDLARVGRMLLNDGMLDGLRILSPQSVELLLAPEWRFDGRNGDTDHGFYCTYGLATQSIPTPVAGCKDNPIGDGMRRQGHAGEAYGLRSGLWLDRAHGTGVAFYVAGLKDNPARGRSAFRASEEDAFRRTLSLP